MANCIFGGHWGFDGGWSIVRSLFACRRFCLWLRLVRYLDKSRVSSWPTYIALVEHYADLFKAGVSINPQRRDAIEELERCVLRGASLVKVLPNAQHFDLANPAYIPFYKRLAELKIPM